jgi:superfamily I DNA/RNA helicase
VVVIGARLWGDEEIRLAYVAATRARENLYWVYNKKKKANIESWE